MQQIMKKNTQLGNLPDNYAHEHGHLRDPFFRFACLSNAVCTRLIPTTALAAPFIIFPVQSSTSDPGFHQIAQRVTQPLTLLAATVCV